MGQILSDEGDQDEAINCLIDALRWDSTNAWALLMMGNIFAKFKNDIPTAMKYYDQALIAKPNDTITMNNIAANLLQQGKLVEAKRYFLEALKIDESYPNTLFALGLIANNENNFPNAFNYTIKALKANKNRDILYQNSVRQAFEVAKKIITTDAGKQIFTEYRHRLEFESNTEIDCIEDNKIPTIAKFELAENYKRRNHAIRYKTNYPAVEHLMMHELVHFEFILAARKEGINQLFLSDNEHKSAFIKSIEPTLIKLKKRGIAEESIANYCTGLFEGLNRQIFNTAIDLFIEDYLYKHFPALRAYQFLSLYTLNQEGLKAVTDKNVVELSPSDVLSKSKIYNIVNALQFKALYGIDLTKDFRATATELKQATDFYTEYLEYKDNKAPAEEYELLMHWAEDLKLDNYFELEGEIQFRKRSDINNFITSAGNDPFDIEERDPVKEREMRKFQKSQQKIETNMAVVMYMVEALRFFDGKPKDEVHKIAYEIAMHGTMGFTPDKKGYQINAIPNKDFSGYHILAYYYVSFAIAHPDVLPELKLPYDNEYTLALTLKE